MSSIEPQAVVTPVSTGPLVWLNGDVNPLTEATTSVADHAYLYGDGLFEGIRIYHKTIFKFDEHMDRLYDGVQMLDIRGMMPQSELRQIILDTCAQAGIADGYIRLNVSRGTGLGLDPSKIDQTPNVMVMVNYLKLFTPDQYVDGLQTVTVSTRVFPPQCLDPRLKTIGRYVANIQAKIEANRQGAGEGLMLNVEGFVAEGTGENIFILRDNRLSTPGKTDGILQGITRNTVIEIGAELGYEVAEESLTLYDVYTADEVFFTGTAAEIISVVKVDGRVIGDGKPGPHRAKISARYHELAKLTGTAF